MTGLSMNIGMSVKQTHLESLICSSFRLHSFSPGPKAMELGPTVRHRLHCYDLSMVQTVAWCRSGFQGGLEAQLDAPLYIGRCRLDSQQSGHSSNEIAMGRENMV